ncbi:hypothetical protein TALC_00154 [Thermoplasmatales archaeon BRNA1]|nr:hypothetical protein TALC_00154 [Thermoplasmatales archaeon BRNA1]
MRAVQLVGEVLYRQERMCPLAERDLDPRMFDMPPVRRQMWRDLLTKEEAAAISCYGRREARWLEVESVDSIRAAAELGSQYPLVRRLSALLSSACSKS